MNSVAGRSDHGPVQPKSETVTTTHCGDSAEQTLRIDTALGRRGPVAVTITMSAPASSSSETVVTLRFPALR